MCQRIMQQNISAGKLPSIFVAKAKKYPKCNISKTNSNGYNYSLFCQEMAQENGIIPHTDLSAAAVQLFLNIPILVIQSSYLSNPTTHKKEWHCCAQEALGPSKQLDIHKFNIVIVDNNDGFVGATAPTPITHLKEDMISLQDNLKYSVESVHTVLDSVPHGSQFHKCKSRILTYLTAAKELWASAVATTGTASVTLLEPMAPVPPMHWGIPAKKRKRAVSHTVTSQEEAGADTPAPMQMVPDVKFVHQVTSPVASCKLHTLANFESVAMSDFRLGIATYFRSTILCFYPISNQLQYIVADLRLDTILIFLADKEADTQVPDK